MVRFWDITVFLFCLTMFISMINTMAVFPNTYMEVPDNPAFNMSDVRSQVSSNSGSVSSTDYLSQLVGFGSIAITFIFTFVSTTFWSYGVMTSLFHVPPILAAAIEGLMVYSLISFLIQVYLKFGFKSIQD